MQVRVLQSLLRTLERSEKTILREAGLHPTKNRTRNLVNYLEFLSDEESNLMVELLVNHGNESMHLGKLPFVNRNYALDVIHASKKRASNHWGFDTMKEIRGKRADIVVVDDIEETVRNKKKHQAALKRAVENFQNKIPTCTGRLRRG